MIGSAPNPVPASAATVCSNRSSGGLTSWCATGTVRRSSSISIRTLQSSGHARDHVGAESSLLVEGGRTQADAARIQGRCNELGEVLLISASTKNMLPRDDRLAFKPVGAIDLRGREERVELVGVSIVGDQPAS